MKKLIQAMKMAMATFFRFRVRIITAAIAFMILFSLINYCTNDNIASATMSLNYSEASAGLNPNSTRFNMSEIVSEKVMSRVVEAAGIEDKVAWSDLSKCVSTQSVDSGRSSDSYISTTYQITYDESKLASKPKHMPNSEDMVKLICNTYKSFFLDFLYSIGDSNIIKRFTIIKCIIFDFGNSTRNGHGCKRAAISERHSVYILYRRGNVYVFKRIVVKKRAEFNIGKRIGKSYIYEVIHIAE